MRRHTTLGTRGQASDGGSRATLIQLHNGNLTAVDRDSFPDEVIFESIKVAKMNSS
jgi:hypothetical protein